MRCTIPLLIVLLAPVVATGCREAPDAEAVIPPEPREVYVTVKAYLKNGVPHFNKDYHHTELVRRRDKLSFACACEDGLELTVSEPKLILDLEALESLVEKQEGETLEAKLESLLGELEQAGAYLKKRAVPAGNGDNAYLEEQAAQAADGDNAYLEEEAAPAAIGDSGDFLQAFLGGFIAVIPLAPEARLFDRPWEEPGFYPGNRSIGPFTVGPIDGKGESVWKFTWRVRVQGQPGTEVTWDPHLIGHPDMKL